MKNYEVIKDIWSMMVVLIAGVWAWNMALQQGSDIIQVITTYEMALECIVLGISIATYLIVEFVIAFYLIFLILILFEVLICVIKKITERKKV